VLLFGAGGTLVEVFQDKALELPPLSPLLANKWMQRTKIYRVLQGVRGEAPVDLAQLAEILVKFATLVSAVPDIAELDINPLIASSQGIVALDARVLLS
jgi:acetyltransferase